MAVSMPTHRFKIGKTSRTSPSFAKVYLGATP